MSFLKNPIVLSGLVLLILVAVVWFAGPHIGLARVDFRIFVVLALVVLWVIFALVLFKSQSSSSAQVAASAGSLSVQPPQVSLPSAPSGVQVQMTAPGAMTASGATEQKNLVRSQLDRAIQWLRGSKIGKSKQGVDVVYQLPWYLFMGPTAVGKSMALAQSHLDFPYTDPDRSMGRRGVEPTEGCGIWITNDGFFLDTAGRYCTETEKDSWLALLDQLKRCRKDKPLDGVILGVDLAEVLKLGEDDLKEQARRLRARLDEMMQKFGMVLPVYVMFLKSDRVEGFGEFFRDLSEEERAQVWGCTLKREQYQGLQPHQEFEKEFQQLCDSLTTRRLMRLTSKSPESKDKIYSFPLQLSLAKTQLVEFVTWLFQPNTFRERPIFRGFYFTSSIQEGGGIDLVLEYMNRKVGFLEPVSRSGEKREGAPFFLESLFTQVIFPDRVLSGSSSTRQRRGLLVRIALFLGLGVLLPLLLFFVIRAYNENQRFLAAIDKAAKTEPRGNKSLADLETLRDLRIHLQRFDPHLNSASVGGFQWGMYIGDQILEPAKKIYAHRLKQVFINPAAQDLKIQLRDLVVSPEMGPKEIAVTRLNYFLLKTFLMMSEARRADEKFVTTNQCPLPKSWSQGVQAENIAEANQQLSFYWHQLSVHQDSNYLVSRSLEDEQLVASKRESLLNFNVVQNYYSRIKREGDAKAASMNLSRSLDGKDLDLLTGGAEIPGTFTRNGWETSVKATIHEISEEYERDITWVLGRAAAGIDSTKPGKEAMQAKLGEMYFGDYNKQWWNFLIAVKLNPSNRQDAIERLSRLSRSQDSPMLRLLKSVSSNTFEELSDKPIDNPYQGALVRSFESIHRFMTAGTGQKSPMSQYLEVLAKVYQELYTYFDTGQPPDQTVRMRQVILDALSRTASLTQNFGPESQRIVKPLLEQPIRMAWGLAPASDSQSPVTPPTLAPLTPPSLGAGSGLVIRGMVSAKGGGSIEKATLYLLKPGSSEVTLNNYLTLASTDGSGMFQFPKAMPPGKYALFVKARGFKAVSQDVTLSTGSSNLSIKLAPE